MRYFLVLTIGFLFFACSSTGGGTTDQNPDTQEVQQQLKLHITYLDQYMQTLSSRANSIQVQGRALSDEEMNFVEQVDLLREDIGTWEEKYQGARDGTLTGQRLSDALTTIQALVHRAATLEERSTTQD